MRNLLTDPMSRPQDLGGPIPDSHHAVSVALPLWQHVIGYEEQDPQVIEQLQCGYPRFFLHPDVVKLNALAATRFAKQDEGCVVFPSPAAAQRCMLYIKKRFDVSSRSQSFGWEQLTAVILAADQQSSALKFWRFGGEIVSSRMAASALAANSDASQVCPSIAKQGTAAKLIIRQRLAELSGQPIEDVFLFSCGMSAIFAVQRVASSRFPGRKSAQLEFPYVDALKVQEEFGPGVHEYLGGSKNLTEELRRRLETEPLSAVYTEVPSNPLLRTADLAAVAELTRSHRVPLIIDDTVGSVVNVDAFLFADVVTTSLTKYFSGVGDVMGGAVILNHRSASADYLRQGLKKESGDDLWLEDAIVLEKNSRDFVQRVLQINRTTEQVVDYLAAHPLVAEVCYPRDHFRTEFDAIRREGGGFGGMLSILLKGSEQSAAKFYDALQISKGPSLGANYSLACPYTLLAHYDELPWAESWGVQRELIRISVGLENADELIRRLQDAFDAV
ncbi:MAG: PLP-dependent transferase [Verrucomicrobiales bacterium]|nr:PLP-dependent transferase [Verrucomicrobiales bacterium]